MKKKIQTTNSILSTKLLNNEVSFEKVNQVLKLLSDSKYDYNLRKKKVKLKFLTVFCKIKYDFRKAESLIRQYNNKKEIGVTEIKPNFTTSNERFMILPGNSLDTKFPQGTIINGILTSIPYFNQIEYSEKNSKNNEF